MIIEFAEQVWLSSIIIRLQTWEWLKAGGGEIWQMLWKYVHHSFSFYTFIAGTHKKVGTEQCQSQLKIGIAEQTLPSLDWNQKLHQKRSLTKYEMKKLASVSNVYTVFYFCVQCYNIPSKLCMPAVQLFTFSC